MKKLKINKGCNLCSNNNFVLLYKINGFNIVKCVDCGLVITVNKNFRRADKSSVDIYTKKKYLEYYLSPFVQKLLTKRAVARLIEISAYIKTGKLLDVGCSYGYFLKQAKNEGWDVEGIEPCSKTVDYLRRKISLKIYKGTLSSVRINKKYDVICYWDVLEHIVNPLNELKRVKRILAKDGLLVIQCPNIQSLSAGIAKENFVWLCPEDHLNHFSPQTLNKFLNKAGFDIVELRTWAGDLQRFSQLVNDVFSGKRKKSILRKFFMAVAIFLDKFFPFIGRFFDWIESKFLLNGLIIAYARKK